MPIDPVFRSDWQPHASRRTSGPKESVERQLGRSDARLGEILCPWPPGPDADQWRAGFDAERASWMSEDIRNRPRK